MKPIEAIEYLYKLAVVCSWLDKEQLSDVMLKLQQKDPSYIALWKVLRAISVRDMMETYNQLNVEMPLSAIVGESFYAGMPLITQEELSNDIT